MSLSAEPGVEIAHAVEDGPLRAAYPAMRQVSRLHRVGMRLAVYGVVESGTDAELKLWHVMNPGTWMVPQVAAHPGYGNWGLAHGRTLCGIVAVTNGHASDHTPPEAALCPRCAERL